MPVVRAGDPPYTPFPTQEPSTTVPTSYQRATYATPDTFGYEVGTEMKNVGQQFGQLGGALFNAAIQRQELINRVESDKATNTYQDYETKLLYGDPNIPGDTGYFGMRGQDAVDNFPKIRDQLINMRNSLLKGLGNDRMRLEFDSETRRLQALTLARVGGHFDSEYKALGIAQSKAKIDNGMSAAAHGLSQGDDAAWEAGVGQAMKAALEGLKISGQDRDPAIVDMTLRKIRGEAVKQKAESIGLRSPLDAQKFLENNSDAMERDEYNQLLGKYRAGAAKEQALIDAGMANARGSGAHNYVDDDSGGYGSPGGTGWGQYASEAINTFRKLGASPAFIQAAMAAGLAEGGFKKQWQKAWGKENSFGHWQLNVGGELPEYTGRYGSDESTATQAKYLFERMEEEAPGITKTNDPGAALDAINNKFEKYQGHGPGQRRGFLRQAQAHMGDMASDEGPDRAVSPKGETPQSTGYLAVGDSIAAHLIRKAKVPGDESGEVGQYDKGNTAVSGWQPYNIVHVIQDLGKKVAGKDIILSTGAANVKGTLTPSALENIHMEVDQLLQNGASSVRILGVGNAGFYSNHNDELSKLAGEYAAKGKPVVFTGPLRDVAKDGVHSSNPQALATTAMQTAPPRGQPQQNTSTDVPAGGPITQVGAMAGAAGAAARTASGVGPPTDNRNLIAGAVAGTAGKTEAAAGATATPQTDGAASVKLASNDVQGQPDVVQGSPPARLPRVTRPLPEVEPGSGLLPDSDIPGLAQKIEEIDKRIPKDAPIERFWNAVKVARSVYNMQYQDQQRALKLQNEQKKQQVEAIKDEYLTKSAGDNPPSVADVLRDQRLNNQPEARKYIIDFLERQGKQDPAAQVSKNNLMNVVKRISLPYGDPQKITTEDEITNLYTQQGLTYPDYQHAITRLKEVRTPEGETINKAVTNFLKYAEPTVKGPFSHEVGAFVDPDAGLREAEFDRAVRGLVQQEIEHKRDPSLLFVPKDPNDLRSSPVGQLLNDPRFQSPMRQQMGTQPPAPQKYQSADQVKAAIGHGLTYDQALEILQRDFGYPKAPAPPIR